MVLPITDLCKTYTFSTGCNTTLQIHTYISQEYLKQQCRVFQMYQDPDDKQDPLLISSKKMRSTDDYDIKEDDLLPLDPSILSKNLGLPIMVIVTKVS